MLKEFTLKSGPTPGEKLSFEPGGVTIFVGPNNSGKSLLLREIESYCQGQETTHMKILGSAVLDIDDKTVEQTINSLVTKTSQPADLPQGVVKYEKVSSSGGRLAFQQSIENLLNWKKSNSTNFRSHYVRLFTSRFGGKERFDLVQDCKSGDLKLPPDTLLKSIFQDDAKRSEIREDLFKAFGRYFVVDATNIGKLNIRFALSPPPSNEIERGWSQESCEFPAASFCRDNSSPVPPKRSCNRRLFVTKLTNG